nr:hypothetical protein [Psychrobacter sp.]
MLEFVYFFRNTLARESGLAGVVWVYFDKSSTLPLLFVLKHINHHAKALIQD